LFALVVTGPPGSGKTTLLTALENALADDGIRHAVIEIEAVSWAHPPLSDEQSFLHLIALRQKYTDAGYGLILCGATITSPEYMDGLLTALGSDERLLVRLEADPSALRQRIVERELPSWSGLPHLLASADAIAVASGLLPGMDAVFSTMSTPSLEIADQIRLMRPSVLMRTGTNPLDIAKPS
jgi:energy-coupling factor transporter ATP-binding protein EcfA2